MTSLATDYISWDPCVETRETIKALVEAKNDQELDRRLGQRLAFGTAGLRGPMGAGYNYMNDLVSPRQEIL
jgi:phosphomannomutase